MTVSRRPVRCQSVLSVLAVAALACGACGGDEHPPPGVAAEGAGDSSGFDPYFQSLKGEAVVRAHAVEPGDTYDVSITVRQDFTVVVDDVFFVADVDQDGATPVPTVDPGPLEVFEVLGFTDEARRTDALLTSSASDGFVAVLDFSPAHPDAPNRSTWHVAAIADSRSGRLEFPGRQQHVQDFFDTARAAFVPHPYGSDLELLVGIAQEAHATFIAGGEPRGPIGTHVARVEEEAAAEPYADWYALPEAQRPLQDGSAPPKVLSAMSTRRVVFDIPAELQRDDLFITIRSPHGILSVSALSAGGHFSDVYTPAASMWTVTIEDESGGRLHERDVPAAVWSGSAATQITLSGAGGAWKVAASPIDGAQLSSILDSWVVPGTPSPEPAQ